MLSKLFKSLLNKGSAAVLLSRLMLRLDCLLQSSSFKNLIVLACISSICACASFNAANTPPENIPFNQHAVDLTNEDQVRNLLLAYHQDWQGVPYQYGGLSQRGIDCSGFIYRSYYELLGYEIPRSTQLQAHLGRSVEQQHIQAGDLVFFKTAKKQRHTGIYLGGQEFLHASSSRGVMISRLDNVYWKKHYWMARSLR